MSKFSSIVGQLDRATSNPSNPVVGDEYYNTNSNAWLRYDGIQWYGLEMFGQTTTSTSTSTTSTSTSTTSTSTSTTSTSTSTTTTTSTSTSTSTSTTSTSSSTSTTTTV